MIRCLGGRVIRPEILDTLPASEARGNLADLVRINRRWGGHSTLRKLVAQIIGKDENFSWLDIGAASGDMGEELFRVRPGANVTSLDYIPWHLESCRGKRVAADAFRLPFPPRSFDYVFSSLFLHHFTDEQVIQLLKIFGETARKAVLVIDLLRNPIPYYFISKTQWLFDWHPVSASDGAISVEAAFKPKELLELALRAGLKSPQISTHIPAFRISLWAGTR
jgi:2-polyprenyl-3-methyl-5-hydroxy-6-metoxy-1,4-benzoquinol methylase